MKYFSAFIIIIINLFSASLPAADTGLFSDPAPAIRRNCNIMSAKTHWQEGQALDLREVQRLLTDLKLPTPLVVSPRSAIDEVMNLAYVTTPQVYFHCIEPASSGLIAQGTNLPENTVFLTFYFTYLTPDKIERRTSDIVVSIDLKALRSLPGTMMPATPGSPPVTIETK
jgi:hypothetical protein